MKKSRVWSSAIRIMTNPRSRSIESSLGRTVSGVANSVSKERLIRCSIGWTAAMKWLLGS